jgi:hypothetical protein
MYRLRFADFYRTGVPGGAMKSIAALLLCSASLCLAQDILMNDSLAKGKELLAKVRVASGGDKLTAIHDLSQTGSMSVEAPKGSFSLSIVTIYTSDGKSLQTTTTPSGEITQGFDGKSRWLKTPDGVQVVPGGADKAGEELFRQTIFLLAKLSAYTAQALGVTEFGGKQSERVLVTEPSTKRQITIFIDPSTNLIIGTEHAGTGITTAMAEIRETYSDIRDVGGLKIPAKILITQNGEKVATVTFLKIAVNTGVADTVFMKP